jgi:Na+/H+ antiporter NhaB
MLFNLDQSQITGLLSNAPADTSSLIKGVISDVTKNSSGGLLSIGLILAIWSASNGMTAIKFLVTSLITPLIRLDVSAGALLNKPVIWLWSKLNNIK